MPDRWGPPSEKSRQTYTLAAAAELMFQMLLQQGVCMYCEMLSSRVCCSHHQCQSRYLIVQGICLSFREAMACYVRSGQYSWGVVADEAQSGQMLETDHKGIVMRGCECSSQSLRAGAKHISG
jgi:hypothetical protein